MRIFFVFLVLALFSQLSAQDIRVRKMRRDGILERSFILKTNLTEKVVLDCQSFIQGLRLHRGDEVLNFLMGEEECEGLQVRIQESLKTGLFHCLKLEDELVFDGPCRR